MDESIKLRRELMPKIVKGFLFILTVVLALSTVGNVSAQDPEGTTTLSQSENSRISFFARACAAFRSPEL